MTITPEDIDRLVDETYNLNWTHDDRATLKRHLTSALSRLEAPAKMEPKWPGPEIKTIAVFAEEDGRYLAHGSSERWVGHPGIFSLPCRVCPAEMVPVPAALLIAVIPALDHGGFDGLANDVNAALRGNL